MANKDEKDKGPSCACGKVDLYEEWLKNENKKKEVSEESSGKPDGVTGTSSDSTSKES